MCSFSTTCLQPFQKIEWRKNRVLYTFIVRLLHLIIQYTIERLYFDKTGIKNWNQTFTCTGSTSTETVPTSFLTTGSLTTLKEVCLLSSRLCLIARGSRKPEKSRKKARHVCYI